jgi:hypothetical protein
VKRLWQLRLRAIVKCESEREATRKRSLSRLLWKSVQELEGQKKAEKQLDIVAYMLHKLGLSRALSGNKFGGVRSVVGRKSRIITLGLGST